MGQQESVPAAGVVKKNRYFVVWFHGSCNEGDCYCSMRILGSMKDVAAQTAYLMKTEGVDRDEITVIRGTELKVVTPCKTK